MSGGASGPVVVLGGYGALGARVVKELLETTDRELILAGRSDQRARRSALLHPARVRGVYLDAEDRRTLLDVLRRADAVVGCTTGRPLAAIEACIEAGVPFAALTPLALSRGSRDLLDERAFERQTALVLNAGAAPGLAGVLADLLTRRFETLHEIRVACSGPWRGTPGARADLELVRKELRPNVARTSSTFAFPPPIGRRVVRPWRALDLERLRDTHAVERVVYLEAGSTRVGRVTRLVGRGPGDGFAMVAEARRERARSDPDGRIAIVTADPPAAAVPALGAIVRRLLEPARPAGLLSPFELLNPVALLRTLAARGVAVDGLGALGMG